MKTLLTEEQLFKFLLIEMTYPEARKIFFDLSGIDTTKISSDQLKKLYRELALKYHPDKETGNEGIAKNINVAYDVLKTPTAQTNNYTYKERNQEYRFNRDGNGKNNEWVMAGYNGGVPPSPNGSNNPLDINYYKKMAWEISGKPKYSPENEYTFFNFDGTYFRSIFNVLAIPSKLFEVSQMMQTWDRFNNSKGVLFRNKKDPQNVIYLINKFGEEVKPPIKFDHESFNTNPSNDQSFVNQLRKYFMQ